MKKGTIFVPFICIFFQCKYSEQIITRKIESHLPHYIFKKKLIIFNRIILIDLYLYNMNIFRLAFELFILYLVYKLVFDLIIPVAKTTKQVKKQFVDMSAKMEEKMNEQHQQNTTFNTTKATAQPIAKSDDYIDFEEIK